MELKAPQINLIYNRRKTDSPTRKAAVEVRITHNYKQKYISTGVMLYLILIFLVPILFL